MHYDKLCDGKQDCATADDELDCYTSGSPMVITNTFITNVHKNTYTLECTSGDQYYDQTSICHYDTVGGKMVPCEDGTHLGGVLACTEFACIQSFKCNYSYCIPIPKICDGVIDCPNQEDEFHCEEFSCPGHLKCIDQINCVPRWELCDGTQHCRYGDDEKYCQICPEGCACSGSIVSCNSVDIKHTSRHISLFQSPKALMFKDSSAIFESLMSSINVSFTVSLRIIGGTFLSLTKPSSSMFPLLKELSLIRLRIGKVTAYFLDGIHIRYLNLSFNNIFIIEHSAFASLVNIEVLSVISNAIRHIDWHFCLRLTKLKYLYLSDNPIMKVAPNAFVNNLSILCILSQIGTWYAVLPLELLLLVHVFLRQMAPLLALILSHMHRMCLYRFTD